MGEPVEAVVEGPPDPCVEMQLGGALGVARRVLKAVEEEELPGDAVEDPVLEVEKQAEEVEVAHQEEGTLALKWSLN